MDSLQYVSKHAHLDFLYEGFKPCYKWIAFNTYNLYYKSIAFEISFKPCYKWIAFNTLDLNKNIDFMAF